jgi:prepilin-type N-terminal cleavage/methylation domain-containing protein
LTPRARERKREAGFSLIEALVVVLIFSIIMASVADYMSQAQQRANTERVKLDQLQEGRDFVDQIVRDLQVCGYPNQEMMNTASGAFSPALQSPLMNDARLATGIVRIGQSEIWMEGDVVGDGNIYSVVYKLNGTGTCSNCLQRSQVQKVNGNPVTVQSQSWASEVNNVQNTQIFQAFTTTGSALTSTTDVNNDAAAPAGLHLADISLVQINLTIQSSTVDLQTGQPIQVVIQSHGLIRNCSSAPATTGALSCL